MTCNTFIIPQSENTGSYRVISWVSLKGKTPLGTKNSRCDPALPCWFTEEPRAHQESGSCDSGSHTKPRSLSYTEFLLWEQTLPKCIPATDRDLRLNRGLKMHKKEMRLHQAVLPGWPFPTAHHGLAVASCPQEQPVQNPQSPAQDRILPAPSTAPGTWVTQQLTARGLPTLLPAHLLFERLFGTYR